jgi:hypothetical protein
MNRLLVVLGALVPVLLLAADLPPVRLPSPSIEGVWYAKDPRDGSCLHMQITKAPRSGERVYMLVGSDRSAPSWCPEGSRMQGIGVMQPEGLLLTSVVLWCMPDASELRYFHSDALRYDPQADTISDAEGVAFHRQVLLGR